MGSSIYLKAAKSSPPSYGPLNEKKHSRKVARSKKIFRENFLHVKKISREEKVRRVRDKALTYNLVSYKVDKVKMTRWLY